MTGFVNVSPIESAESAGVAGTVLFICIFEAVSECTPTLKIEVNVPASNLFADALFICVFAPLVNLLSPTVLRLNAPFTVCL